MNRRELGRNLLIGAIAVGAPNMALAQAMGGAGSAEQEHATDTLKIGSLALKTSQLAQTKAKSYRVAEFAGFEVDEQTTIAQIIQDATGMAPPPPDAAARAMLAKLDKAAGKAFEMEYVAAQIDGHTQLLAVQERYLSKGTNPAFKYVAMLARGQIKEHLKLLSDIRSGRA